MRLVFFQWITPTPISDDQDGHWTESPNVESQDEYKDLEWPDDEHVGILSAGTTLPYEELFPCLKNKRE